MGLEWVVAMQLAMDILRLLLFPGLLFMLICGYLVLFLEGRLRAALYGGEVPRLRMSAGSGADLGASSVGELAAAALSLAAMGVAGTLLVGVKGDLFALLLLFSAVELLPLFLTAAAGEEESLRTPLLFRTALYRQAALACLVLSVSLRFRGAFSPGLESFRGESAFNAVQLWRGVDSGLILTSLVCAAAAFFVLLLGRPAPASSGGRPESSRPGASHAVAAEGSHRAASLLLFAVIFLGYPWEGGMGLLSWSAAVLGAAAFLTAVRAWLGGLDRVLARRLQGTAPLFALLSLGLAFAAVA